MAISSLHRAEKGIGYLVTIIERLNKKAAGMDAPIHGAKISDETSVNGVPLVFVRTAERIVGDILRHVSALDAPVHDSVAGEAPDWWQEAKSIAAHQRGEDARASAFIDAVAILDRHASDETVRLLCMPFLVDGLELKIMKTNEGPGFRRYGQPNPDGIEFIFHFHFDPEKPDPICKLASDIPELREACVAFFRSVLGEIAN